MFNQKIKRINYIFFVFCCLIFWVRCMNLETTKKAKISSQTAISKAQQFLIEQGYTDKTPTLEKFKFEKGEFATDTFKILNYRKNTVAKKAFAVKQHNASWTVGFVYMNRENNIGRAITMDTLGVNIIMQTKEVRLDWFVEKD